MMRNGGWKATALAGWTLTGTMTAAIRHARLLREVAGIFQHGGAAAFGTGRAQATGLPMTPEIYPYSTCWLHHAAFRTIRQCAARYHSDHSSFAG